MVIFGIRAALAARRQQSPTAQENAYVAFDSLR
jgi:hypothetical protein